MRAYRGCRVFGTSETIILLLLQQQRIFIKYLYRYNIIIIVVLRRGVPTPLRSRRARVRARFRERTGFLFPPSSLRVICATTRVESRPTDFLFSNPLFFIARHRLIVIPLDLIRYHYVWYYYIDKTTENNIALGKDYTSRTHTH